MASEEPVSNAAAHGAEADDAMFDMSLKKKKNKKTINFDLDDGGAGQETALAHESAAASADAAAHAAPAEEENLDDMFGGLKKKSKKKKAVPMDLDEAAAEPAEDGTATEAGAQAAEAVPDGDLDFGELKKKKKKGKKGGFDLEAFEKELGEGGAGGAAAAPGGDEDGGVIDAVAADDIDDADLGDDPFGRDADVGDDKGGSKQHVETWHGTDRDYTYQELMGRIFSTLHSQNPALSGDKKKYTIAPPVVQRDGSKKTMFANVIDICKRLHRQPDHVIQYLFTELGTVGSVDGSQRLIIKGRFQPVQIERVLRKYIVEYVTCKTCRSPNTLLTKENRIYFMRCESCGSTRSVTTIKSGFQAQVRVECAQAEAGTPFGTHVLTLLADPPAHDNRLASEARCVLRLGLEPSRARSGLTIVPFTIAPLCTLSLSRFTIHLYSTNRRAWGGYACCWVNSGG